MIRMFAVLTEVVARSLSVTTLFTLTKLTRILYFVLRQHVWIQIGLSAAIKSILVRPIYTLMTAPALLTRCLRTPEACIATALHAHLL